jgi:molecular chaperone HscB
VLFKNQNFFQLFSLPESFLLDDDALTKNYLALQENVHPDRFANATADQQLQAMQSSSLLNDAFAVLSSPTGRAAYLLGLQGIDVNNVRQAELGQGLLLEQIAIRERLEELPRDESAIAELEDLKAKIRDRSMACQKKFSTQFEAQDYKSAKTIYYEMQYFQKLQTEIEALEEDLLGY